MLHTAEVRPSRHEQSQIIWSPKELENIFGAIVAGAGASGLSINSRTIQPGEIFLAIKGERFDGHKFVQEAFDRGAAVAIVQHLILDLSVSDKARLILVDNTMHALEALARHARARASGTLVGLTGSVGKTSSKEMLKLGLQEQGAVHATEGSLNNHIGVPLTLASMPKSVEFGILEMGMDHPGELHHLSMMAKPDIAIITTIAAVHLESMKTLSAIAEAKSEIFHGMKDAALVLLPFDSPHHDILLNKARQHKLQVIPFGKEARYDAQLLEYEPRETFSRIKARFFDKTIEYTIGVHGEHMAMNSVAVLMTAKLMGADFELAAAKLQHFGGVKGRGIIADLGDIMLIDDSYNASPIALRGALSNLGLYKRLKPGRRLIATLGNMGDTAVEEHEALLEDVIEHRIDKIFTVGDLMRILYNGLPQELRGIHTDTSEEMAKEIIEHIAQGDIILVKGAHYMQMERIVQALIKFRSNNGKNNSYSQ